jgi:hypothetical protein
MGGRANPLRHAAAIVHIDVSGRIVPVERVAARAVIGRVA